MRKLFYSIIAVLATGIGMCSCSEQPTNKYGIQNGDLLFVGLPMNYTLINHHDTAATDTISAEGFDSAEINYIHALILEVDEQGEVWAIEATKARGVDRHPLDTFLVDFTLRDGTLPYLEVMRLKDNSMTDEYVENAKKFLGEEYDVEFYQDNGRHYCTELIYDSYLTDTTHVFSLSPTDFSDSRGIIPPYWRQVFSIFGATVPQGHMGTLPAQMHASDKLVSVGDLKCQ